MSTLLILAVLSAPPAATSKSTAKKDASKPRRYHLIEKDVRNTLRAEAIARKPAQKKAALLTIIKLYKELKADPRLETSPTLQTNQKKLFVRMSRIKRKIVAKQRKKRGRVPRRNRRSRKSLSQIQNEQKWQRISKEADQSLASVLSLSSFSLGGPSQVFAATQKRGGAAADDGQELVELIESVIAPDFWDTNGGPGSIRYYQPLHALVVRATSEMHHSIGTTLKQLRKVSN